MLWYIRRNTRRFPFLLIIRLQIAIRLTPSVCCWRVSSAVQAVSFRTGPLVASQHTTAICHPEHPRVNECLVIFPVCLRSYLSAGAWPRPKGKLGVHQSWSTFVWEGGGFAEVTVRCLGCHILTFRTGAWCQSESIHYLKRRE